MIDCGIHNHRTGKTANLQKIRVLKMAKLSLPCCESNTKQVRAKKWHKFIT